MKKKVNVLMCGSNLSVKGGMVSVVKNYLKYNNWDKYNIIYVPTHIERNKISASLYFSFAYIKILYILLTKKIDIIHLHTAERGSFYRKAMLVQLCNKFGVKTIMHHHGAEFDKFYEQSSDRKKKYISRILEEATVNIVLSNILISSIKSKAPNAKVDVLYNSVYTYYSNPYNSKANSILFLGRLGKRKGTYDLLNAIKVIDKLLPSDIRFFLCGDGEIESIKVEIDRLHISHRIQYIGWIDDKDKQKIFSQSMINVLPSYNEGLPMTILETMAYGIPNISTAIASIPEVVINGNNGFLVAPGDIDKLSRSLVELCSDSKLRLEFSEKSYNMMIEKFSINKNIDRLKQIYSTYTV